MSTEREGRPVVLVRDERNVVYSFSRRNCPRAKAAPGDTVIFETMDCFSGQLRSSEDKFEKIGWDRINPATGPLYVEGANDGDTLCVEIADIQVDGSGVMVAVPGLGAAPDRIRESTTFAVPLRYGLAHLPQGVISEVKPMVGVIGNAPAVEDVPCGTPGPHGGNLDTKVIQAGSTVYLPVFTDGALLALGDLHALMGDGEVLVCGVEVPGRVTVNLGLVKGWRAPCPIVETEEAFFVIWSAETLDEACRGAVNASIDLVRESLGCPEVDALALLSVLGNLQISQVVDPLKTVRMEVPKAALKGRSLILGKRCS